MIITEKKHQDEILSALENTDKIFIVGCGGCASKCNTGNESAVEETKEFLERNSKQVTGTAVLDSACDIRLAKKDLSKNDSFLSAHAVVMLACGAGSQAVEKVTDKIIIPALNSKYLGTTERIGVYKQLCTVCGTCIIKETEGICPRTRCPKSLVNGSCGGYVDGKCETDQTKDCAWVLIYDKLKKKGTERKFIESYIKPKTNDEIQR